MREVRFFFAALSTLTDTSPDKCALIFFTSYPLTGSYQQISSMESLVSCETKPLQSSRRWFNFATCISRSRSSGHISATAAATRSPFFFMCNGYLQVDEVGLVELAHEGAHVDGFL